MDDKRKQLIDALRLQASFDEQLTIRMLLSAAADMLEQDAKKDFSGDIGHE